MENLKDRLEREFKDDPIRKEITYAELDSQLYTVEILSMHLEASYSTTDASRILSKPDSTIRNYFRTDLKKYINPEMIEGRYKLNYQGIFKLRMFLLLSDKCKRTTTDFLTALGLKATHVLTDGKRLHREEQPVQYPSISYESFETTKKMLSQLLFQNSLMLKKDELQKLQNQLQECTYQISYLELENEKIRTEYRFDSLKERQDKFLNLAIRESGRKGGFFQSFKQVFSKNDDDIEKVIEDSKHVSDKLDEELEAKLNADLKEKNDKLEALRTQKVNLINSIKDMTDEIKFIENSAQKEVATTDIEENEE